MFLVNYYVFIYLSVFPNKSLFLFVMCVYIYCHFYMAGGAGVYLLCPRRHRDLGGPLYCHSE